MTLQQTWNKRKQLFWTKIGKHFRQANSTVSIVEISIHFMSRTVNNIYYPRPRPGPGIIVN